MRDYIWPRCPSGWNGEEKQFFRALISVLQQLGQPIDEKDLSEKLQAKINDLNNQGTTDHPETPEAPWQYEFFNEGFIDGVVWLGNVLKRPQYTGAGVYSLNNVGEGYMQSTIKGMTNEVPVSFNTHLITDSDFEIPESVTKMKIDCVRYCGYPADTTPLYVQFGVLPSDAPGAYDVSKGGQLSETVTISQNERTIYETPITVKGKYKLIINTKGNSGAKNGYRLPTRGIRIYRVWFE